MKIIKTLQNYKKVVTKRNGFEKLIKSAKNSPVHFSP